MQLTCCLTLLSLSPPVPYTAREIPFMYSFPGKRGLSPNFRIHVSLSDLYIPRISPHISLQPNMQIDLGNILISHRYMSVGTGRQNITILFWK
jgi:hypothetical protein